MAGLHHCIMNSSNQFCECVSIMKHLGGLLLLLILEYFWNIFGMYIILFLFF